MNNKKRANLKQEVTLLSNFYNNNHRDILNLFEKQLQVIQQRAQVAVGFGAVTITTTGFSGRLIAGTNLSAQICIILGLACVLSSCCWIFIKVLRIEWLTAQIMTNDPQQTLLGFATYRDNKKKAYSIGIYGILTGMIIYTVAIGIMLLNPEPLNLPIR